MWSLFKGEVNRFRVWSAVAALAHLVALGFMTRMVDLGQQPLLVHRAFGGVYALVGFLLGLYQVGTYRRPAPWMQLLHRPLPHARIALAFATATGVLLLLAIALPMLLLAVWQHGMTARVVDLRHWLLPLSAFLIALSGYLAGGFCALRGFSHAAAAMALLAWLLFSRACGWVMLGIELIVVIWMGVLLVGAFKPDLTAPPRSLPATVLLALPLQVGIYLLMVLLLYAMELVWVVQGSHPLNTPTPPPGGHVEIERLAPRARMLSALGGGSDPEIKQLARIISGAKPASLNIRLSDQPQFNELSNVAPLQFDDRQRRIRWVFSHDQMRLQGYGLLDGRSVGPLGDGSAQRPFPHVALPVGSLPGMPEGDAALIAGDTLYRYVSSKQQVLPYMSADAGETVAGAGRVGTRLVLMSDKALYFFGRGDATGGDASVGRVRVPMPASVGDLSSLDMVALPDGNLVCLTYSEHAHDLLGAAPALFLLRTHDDGRVELIQRRSLSFDYPAVHRYRAWWISPLLHAVWTGAQDALATPSQLSATAPAPTPDAMKVLAASLLLLSAVMAAWWTRSTALSRRARGVWVATCGLFGLPALAMLGFMVARHEPASASDGADVRPDGHPEPML